MGVKRGQGELLLIYDPTMLKSNFSITHYILLLLKWDTVSKRSMISIQRSVSVSGHTIFSNISSNHEILWNYQIAI